MSSAQRHSALTLIRNVVRLWLFLLACPAHGVVAGSSDDADDPWSRCACPAAGPGYENATDAARKRPPSASMAYLISVHNKRTIQDGAHLLKALLETSYPGNTAIILVHVDARVGIASRDDHVAAEAGGEENRFLYHDSSLKRYVEACLAAPACARDGRNHNNARNPHKRTKATILEVHSRFSPEWSKWSMNDPTIWAMEYLLYHRALDRQRGSPSWDVFVNLSGDTLPVVTAERIAQLFEPRDGPLGKTNFVTSAACATGLVPTSIFDFPRHSMKRSHYFQRKMPRTLSYLDALTGAWSRDAETPVHFGSQWMALCRDFVEHVVRGLAHPNGLGSVLKGAFLDAGVLMTDETFFATLLMNSPAFNGTVPRPDGAGGGLARRPALRTLRYERMDENAPDAWGEYASSSPLYDVPPGFGGATGGEGPARPWGPYFLGVYDLGALKDSGALFARKVSGTVDGNLVRMLPVEDASELPDIRWPELGVKIKDPFVWEAEKKQQDGSSKSG